MHMSSIYIMLLTSQPKRFLTCSPVLYRMHCGFKLQQQVS